MAETDLVGKYFHSLFLAGDKREFYFEIQGKTYPIPHDEMDGQFGLRKSLESQGLKFTTATNPNRKIPSLFKRIIGLVRWLSIKPDRAIWRTRREKAGFQKHAALTIAKADLDRIKSEISHSLTAHLIHSLNKAMLPHFKNSKTSWWLLPVALPDSTRTSGNHISFLDLLIPKEMTAEEVGAQLKEKLKNGEYWGHLMAFKLLHFISPKLLSKFLPHFFSTFQRTMTFSHLGQWEVPDLKMEDFNMIAPAFSLSPVFLVCIELNGNMGLYLSQQSHLDLPLESIMKNWKETLNLSATQR